MLRDAAHAPRHVPAHGGRPAQQQKNTLLPEHNGVRRGRVSGPVSMYPLRSRMSLPPPGRPVPPAAAAAPARVLLVEDDVEISRMVVEVLHENGFAASAVPSS